MTVGLELDGEIRRGDFVLRASLRVGDETVALTGANGAGKTTLLHAIAGLVPLAAGRLAVGARDATGAAGAAGYTVLDAPDAPSAPFVPPHRRGVAMVFQDHLLFPFLDARDNVAFALRRAGVARGEARARAEAALADYGVAHLARARPGRLSGGEAQRVALARALVGGPQIVLLDEPLAALDAAARRDNRALLRERLAAIRGPKLLVTHDREDLAALCAREYRLERTTGFEPATLTLAR